MIDHLTRMPGLLVLMAVGALAGRAQAQEVECATAVTPPGVPIVVTEGELAAAWRSGVEGLSLGTFNIVINAGPTLAGNAPALAAWGRAANQWEALIADPITVTIDADMANLGGGTIGTASSLVFSMSYDTVRDAMVADAALETGDGVVSFLPTSAGFGTFLRAGFTLDGDLRATKANMKALGFTGLDVTWGATDATITLNSMFSFDFDNSDGVGAGLTDFETVAAHELGHALGFVSTVDAQDGGPPTAVSPTSLDLFRFENGTANDPASNTDFGSFTRSMVPGTDEVTDDVATQWRMSTGASLGDGRQAAHWKDDGLSGVTIGVMDPTLASQTVIVVSAADERALDVIGYDIGVLLTTTSTVSVTTTSTTTTTLPNGDVGVTAKKLLIVDKLTAATRAKVVYLSRDKSIGTIEKGSGTSTSDISVEFTFEYVDGSTGGAFSVPAGPTNGTHGWLKNTPEVAKYVNKGAPSAPTGVKATVMKPGKLIKIVGKHLGDTPIDIFTAGPPSPAGVTTVYTMDNGVFSKRHCSLFTACTYKLIASETGAKLVCKLGMPTACP